ncbi:MAG: hypothetical protein LBK95_02050 [Bifidobacteriaceae bacterium]|jgi:hypothetical protein|nr:hypothetical protein [Bifidobacteriaceae bacterium]
MHRRAGREANWLGRVAALAVAAVAIVLACLPVAATSAAFIDSEYGSFDLTAEAPPAPRPAINIGYRGNYLGATQVGLSQSGSAAYVWGYRDGGLSGTGAKVDPTADISVVKLPGGLKIAGITGGSNKGNSQYYNAAIGVLAQDGSVWTWGVADEHRLGRPVTDANRWLPGKVEIPGKVIDLQSGANSFVALTDDGDLYTFGAVSSESYSTYGALGQGAAAISGTVPRRILTKVHSFGVALNSVWAVVAPGWTNTTYSGNDTADQGSTTAPGERGEVLFWGYNELNGSGAASGDPDLKNTYCAKPTRLSTTAVLNQLLWAGSAAGDQNETLGVAMGSPEDSGTFRQMTGSVYGNQVLLADGRLFTWGYSANGYYGSGNNTGMSTRQTMVPTQADLGGLKVQAVAHTMRLTMLLDQTGTAWIYGRSGPGEEAVFPKPDGTVPIVSSSSPVRIEGDEAPGWQAGGITGMAGNGNMSFMLTRDDGSLWLAGGSDIESKVNDFALVRDHWTSAGNTVRTDAAQPILQVDFSGLPD